MKSSFLVGCLFLKQLWHWDIRRTSSGYKLSKLKNLKESNEHEGLLKRATEDGDLPPSLTQNHSLGHLSTLVSFIIFVFLGPYPQHAEVPRLGV